MKGLCVNKHGFVCASQQVSLEHLEEVGDSSLKKLIRRARLTKAARSGTALPWHHAEGGSAVTVVIGAWLPKNSCTRNWQKQNCARMPLQTIFSVFLDIFYPPDFGCFEKNGLFQHPRDVTTATAEFPRYIQNRGISASARNHFRPSIVYDYRVDPHEPADA